MVFKHRCLLISEVSLWGRRSFLTWGGASECQTEPETSPLTSFVNQTEHRRASIYLFKSFPSLVLVLCQTISMTVMFLCFSPYFFFLSCRSLLPHILVGVFLLWVDVSVVTAIKINVFVRGLYVQGHMLLISLFFYLPYILILHANSGKSPQSCAFFPLFLLQKWKRCGIIL